VSAGVTSAELQLCIRGFLEEGITQMIIWF